MANVVNPVADPIGFIVFFFIFGVGEDPFGTLLKLSILSSVIAFPFVLLGKLVYGWVEKSVKSIHLVKLFLTSLITVFLFIIVMRLWYALFGSTFLSVSLSDFLIGFAVAVVIAFIFAILGDFLNHIVHKQWQVPEGLTLYVIDLIVCFVFLIVVYMATYLEGV